MEIYDIDSIIKYALQSNIDISPTDHKEWRMFACSLKVLGYDENTFVWLSSGNEKASRQAWRAERNPTRYKTEEGAKAMIAKFAKDAGIDMKQFLLSHGDKQTSAGHRDRRPTAPAKDTAPKQEPTAPRPYFIPRDAVRRGQDRMNETALYAWMVYEFGKIPTEFIFECYCVGASSFVAPNGYRANSFPYIDVNRRIVDCKLFHIDPTTGSRKTAAPISEWIDPEGEKQQVTSTWAIAEQNKQLRRKGQPELTRAPWCNFGDHLLTELPNAEVCIVESEKTALICALTYPDSLWIAVGSKYNLQPNRFQQYRGRKITIFPDRDGYNDKPRKDGHGTEKGWRTIARELVDAGFNIFVDTTTERHEGGEKDDIADIILRYRHGTQTAPPNNGDKEKNPKLIAEEVFERLKMENPELARFADMFNMEAVSIESYNPEIA